MRWMSVFSAMLGLALLMNGAAAQEPHLGYVFPAGGAQGSVFQVLLGGQFLRQPEQVHISGEGVTASVVWYLPTLRGINGEERKELARRLYAHYGDAARGDVQNTFGFERFVHMMVQRVPDIEKPPKAPVALPEHPIIEHLDNLGEREKLRFMNEFMVPRHRKQRNAQLEETVLLCVVVEPDAAPGWRELRLKTRQGLTNPMRFEVGAVGEVCEQEPNDWGKRSWIKLPEPVDVPVVLNGQALPGDADCFPFRAQAGQQLVFRVEARSLMPYLADAVPGWFQAVLTLYDPKGAECAFADDFRGDPDPVLYYEVPEDGVYTLEVRDAIYRGREDFVYRVVIGEFPFVTQAFPLGARVGQDITAELAGWNLPTVEVALDTAPEGPAVRTLQLDGNGWRSNPVRYAVGDWPEAFESEPNDAMDQAQPAPLPLVMNGRIDAPGDVDVFAFQGHAGEVLVAETTARRLGSPLDGLVQVLDASGAVVAWNDDHEDKGAGLDTHHADPYLRAQLPADGAYFVRIADTQRHGGPAYAYRLRLSAPRPDFALRVVPASIGCRRGETFPVEVHVLRKDGFEGPLDIVLADPPGDFVLSGGHIPAGKDRVRMTVRAPFDATDAPVALTFQGVAAIGGDTVRRNAVPAEDMMQAFLYRHLAPAEACLVDVREQGGRAPKVLLAQAGPFTLSPGAAAAVAVTAPKDPRMAQVQLKLDNPPEGFRLEDVEIAEGEFAFDLAADATVEPGFVDNVIVEAFVELDGFERKDGSIGPKRRVSLGVLPAIPVEVVP